MADTMNDGSITVDNYYYDTKDDLYIFQCPKCDATMYVSGTWHCAVFCDCNRQWFVTTTIVIRGTET